MAVSVALSASLAGCCLAGGMWRGEEEARQVEEVFKLFDEDGDGEIPMQEVGTALRALHTYPSVCTLLCAVY